MSTNPYQAPAFDVTLEVEANNSGGDYLYRVSKKKFFALYIATLGLYVVYWSYKNWSFAKENANLVIWPVMRGIFLIFFLHSLMRVVAKMAKKGQVRLSSSYQSYATIAVIFLIVDKILDNATRRNIGYPITDLISLLMLFALAMFFLGMQNVINIVSGDKDGLANSTFSAANIIWIVVGAAWWIVVIYGYVQIVTAGGQG